MPSIVLAVAQAAELLPLASQQLCRIQYQQGAAKLGPVNDYRRFIDLITP